MAEWLTSPQAIEKAQALTADELFHELDRADVKRSGQDRWRGMLPYLKNMAPAPTYANLSKAAVGMALAWDPDGWSEAAPRADTPLSVHSVSELGDGASTLGVDLQAPSRRTSSPCPQESALGPEDGGPVDPLPLSLPDVLRSSGTAKGGAVSVAALPAFYQSTPPPEAHIPIEDTFAAAEKLGRGPSYEERTGQEWFNSTGLLRMQDLWESHAIWMDKTGKGFIDALEGAHATTLHDIAQVKTFDLKPILAAMKRYTDQVRFMTLDMYQDARRHEDEFSNSLYSVVRTHFDKGLASALEGCESRHRDKLRTVLGRHQNSMSQVRDANKAQLGSQLAVLQAKAEKRHKLEMFALKEGLENQLKDANETIQKLRMEGDKLAVEVKHLREEVVSMATEIKINAGWKARYQKDSAKHDSLKKQIVEERRKHVEYVESMTRQHIEVVRKRDEVIERSRHTIFKLEAGLQDTKKKLQTLEDEKGQLEVMLSEDSAASLDRGSSPGGSPPPFQGRRKPSQSSKSIKDGHHGRPIVRSRTEAGGVLMRGVALHDEAAETPMRRKLRIVTDPAHQMEPGAVPGRGAVGQARPKKAVTLSTFAEREGEDEEDGGGGRHAKPRPRKAKTFAHGAASPGRAGAAAGADSERLGSGRSVKIVNMGDAL
eukprot:jgi/Tetstr1/444891/TSEL_032729.t1